MEKPAMDSGRYNRLVQDMMDDCNQPRPVQARTWIIHPSDCSIHEHDRCDCGGLDLAQYAPEDFVPTLIAHSGRVGLFVKHGDGECLVDPKVLPPWTLAAVAAAADLPDAHYTVTRIGDADGMNLDNPREAIVAQLKSLSGA